MNGRVRVSTSASTRVSARFIASAANHAVTAGLFLTAGLLIAGCGVRNGAPAGAARLEGQVTYRERIALPPDAIAYVHLVTAGDEEGPPIAEDRIAPAGQVPVRFTLEYPESSIDTARSYALRARIEDGAGRVLFETARSVPVEPWSARTVEILLTRPQREEVPESNPEPWERARRAGADIRGIGQEPGWTVEVHEGERIILVSAYGERTDTFPSPVRETLTAGAERYTASVPRAVEVRVEPTSCSDVMSGERFPLTITVIAPPDTLRGCGRRLD